MASKQQSSSEHVPRLERLALWCAYTGDTERLELVLRNGLSVNTRERNERGCTLLHLAAMNGNTEMVIRLLQLGAEKSIVTDAHGTALHKAAICGHASTVKVLLEAGCPMDIVDSNGASILHAAAQGGNAEVIKEVFSRGCDINATNNYGTTPLHYAAGSGKTEAALALIRLGAKKAIIAGIYGTPLHVAASCGQVATVKALLKANCPTNVLSSTGASILHAAAQGGNAEIIREVKSAVCDINTMCSGMTPLHVAAVLGNTEAALELIRLGAENTIVAGEFGTPLHQAALRGHVSTVRALLKAGCPVDVVNSNGRCVLHVAAESGNTNVIRELLTTVCDIDATCNNGMTPLHMAAANGKTKAALQLIRHGAKKAIVAGVCGTPLHQAAEHGHLSTVKAMLKAGCPVNVLSSWGKSVLHAAAQGGSADVIRELLCVERNFSAKEGVSYSQLQEAAETWNTMTLNESAPCGDHDQSRDNDDLGVNKIDRGGMTPLHYAVLSGKKDCVRVLLNYGANHTTFAPYVGSPYVCALVSAPTLVEEFNNFLAEQDRLSPFEWKYVVLKDTPFSTKGTSFQRLHKSRVLRRDLNGVSQLEYMIILSVINGTYPPLDWSLAKTANLLLLAAIHGLCSPVNQFISLTDVRQFTAQTVISLLKLHYSLSMSQLQELVPPDASSLNLMHVTVLAMAGAAVGDTFVRNIRGDHLSVLKHLVTNESYCHTLHEYLPNGLTLLDLAEKLGLDKAATIISSAGGGHGIYAMISEEVKLQFGPTVLLVHQELMKLKSKGELGQQAVQAVVSHLLGNATAEQGTSTDESYLQQQKVLDQRPDLAVIVGTVLPKLDCQNWKDIGILLHVPSSALDDIDQKHNQPRHKYREALIYWLNHSKAASWRTLLEVLGHFETKYTMDQMTSEILATENVQVS